MQTPGTANHWNSVTSWKGKKKRYIQTVLMDMRIDVCLLVEVRARTVCETTRDEYQWKEEK